MPNVVRDYLRSIILNCYQQKASLNYFQFSWSSGRLWSEAPSFCIRFWSYCGDSLCCIRKRRHISRTLDIISDCCGGLKALDIRDPLLHDSRCNVSKYPDECLYRLSTSATLFASAFLGKGDDNYSELAAYTWIFVLLTGEHCREPVGYRCAEERIAENSIRLY